MIWLLDPKESLAWLFWFPSVCCQLSVYIIIVLWIKPLVFLFYDLIISNNLENKVFFSTVNNFSTFLEKASILIKTFQIKLYYINWYVEGISFGFKLARFPFLIVWLSDFTNLLPEAFNPSLLYPRCIAQHCTVLHNMHPSDWKRNTTARPVNLY